nr:PGC-1 and ERR-induced regulator in muscle protein 1 [Syngnathus scovelli]
MEDLEFSVEICDRDWQCFFEMCEECDLHPPSLATADDSGLSDGDHTKSAPLERAPEAHLTGCYSEAECSLDNIHDCKGLDVKTQLGEPATSGMESILSGSEEDIHLQSVNMFFEGVTKRAIAGKNKASKQQEDGLCSNGMEVSSELAARDETIVVKKNDLDKMNTLKKAQLVSYTLQEPPSCSSELKTGRSTHTESLHKPEASFSLHVSQITTVSTKEVLSPSSSPANMKRKRRKKRSHSMPSSQSRLERGTDDEQSFSPAYRDIKVLSSNELQKTDEFATTAFPCGGTCQHGSNLVSFIHPSCEDQFNLEDSRSKVQAPTRGAHLDNDGDDVDGGQGDTLSAAKSVLAAEALHSGRDEHTWCQRQTEHQQQLEMETHHQDQNSHDVLSVAQTQKSTFLNAGLQKGEITRSPVDEMVTKVTCAELTSDSMELSDHKRISSERPSGLALKETEHHVERNKCDNEDCEISSFADHFTHKKEITPEFGNKRPVQSSSNKNIAGPCSRPCQDPFPVDRCASVMLTHEERAHGTGQMRRDLKAGDEAVLSTSCVPEDTPNSKHPIFVMSSFWSEMEKLTINDIMGLRKTNKETDESNSGLSSQCVKSKALPAGENTCGHLDSTSSKLLWENKPVDVYTDKAEETSFIGSPRQGSPPKNLRKISKNASVYNLRALDSLEPHSQAKKGQTLQTLKEVEVKEVDEHNQASTRSYSFSLSDIFQFLLGGKQQIHSGSVKDDINMDGNSLPETYDHFFAEFGIENFFYPFVTEKEHTKAIKLTSAQTNLHLPDAYEYFFASSSSDDSAGEEEEEEDESCGPVRVVSRFTQKLNTTQTLTDNYENFFCDSDMRENFFRTATFSFRNFHLTGGAVQSKRSLPSSIADVGQNMQRAHPSHDLGHIDFPDLLIQQRENMITTRMLPPQLQYEDIRRAVPNPRTDVALLPLRQSDMCLVCIAFASWVLKTANPQVGDMWKAVLLANVSALSAIRYLRKNVKVEVEDAQKKEHFTTHGGT